MGTHMEIRNKIYSGGIYLIDQSGNVNPEFGLNHYAILMKTNKADLYLAFPLTTSEKRKVEKYTIPRPDGVDNEYILLYQAKPISKNRVIGKKTKGGEHVIVSEDNCKYIFDEYLKYINDIKMNNIISIKAIYENKDASKKSLILECQSKISVFQYDLIDYDSLVISFKGGKLTHTEISTRNTGHKTIKFKVADKYGQSIIKTVDVEIIEKDKELASK